MTEDTESKIMLYVAGTKVSIFVSANNQLDYY